MCRANSWGLLVTSNQQNNTTPTRPRDHKRPAATFLMVAFFLSQVVLSPPRSFGVAVFEYLPVQRREPNRSLYLFRRDRHSHWEWERPRRTPAISTPPAAIRSRRHASPCH